MTIDPNAVLSRNRKLSHPDNAFATAAQSAAAATVEQVLFVDKRTTQNDGPAIVVSAAFIPTVAITGVATNNATVNLCKRTNGGAAVVVATLTFASGTNGTAFKPSALAVNSANAALAPGDVVTVQLVQNGTGLALPAGAVTFDLTVAS